MKSPKCKLCGHEHAGLDHIWDEPAAAKSTAARMDVHQAVRMTEREIPQPEPQDRIGGSGDDPQEALKAAGTQARLVDTKFDRNAYQRDYMRKRRAAFKAKAIIDCSNPEAKKRSERPKPSR